MPKPSLEITTSTEITLSAKLSKQLKLKLTELRDLQASAAILKARIGGGKVPGEDGELVEVPGVKAELETLFADADEYEALENGVRVDTPFGSVPMKIVKGKTAKRWNPKKAMTTLYVKRGSKFEKCTLADLEKCYDAPKDKAPYLGVWLPGEDEGRDE